MPVESNIFGRYLRLVIAQTTNPAILNAAQNGGAVAGLMTFALERKIIDGAIVSAVGTEKPFYPLPIVAKAPQEILESAGTRYTYSPNIQVLSEAKNQVTGSLAFVGTPCQIAAVRRMQEKETGHARSVKLLVGLMCSEAFSYEGLMVEQVQKEFGIDLHKVKKTRVDGNRMTITTNEGEVAVPLIKIKKYALERCARCVDFSSELADISAGGLGLRDWTFVIVRTPIGEEVLAAAERAKALVTRPVQMDDPPVKLLMRMSLKKRNRGGEP